MYETAGDNLYSTEVASCMLVCEDVEQLTGAYCLYLVSHDIENVKLHQVCINMKVLRSAADTMNRRMGCAVKVELTIELDRAEV
jgi:hypothetical protein